LKEKKSFLFVGDLTHSGRFIVFISEQDDLAIDLEGKVTLISLSI